MAEYEYTQLRQRGGGGIISAQVEIRRPRLCAIGKSTAIDTGFYCTT